jgi:hypothetical protein
MDGVVSGGPRHLAVYTTTYPAALRFLRGWYASLQEQTDSDFELWIGLDGITPAEVEFFVGEKLPAHWISAAPGDSPSALRARAIETMAGGCDAVLFVDSDDEMFPARVALARSALARYDVAACGLRIVDEGGADTGLVFGPSGAVDWENFLPRYNVFGLSNTAYRTETLRRLPSAPVDGPAIDWSLATRAWCAGASLHFDPEPQMAYRQYAANVAKVVPPFAAADVARATDVVRAHYRAMVDGGVPLPPRFRGRLEGARERVEHFRVRVVERPEQLDRYVATLNAIEPQYVWWWCVAHPELEWQWRN